VLANVLGDNLTMLRVGVSENVLDQVVTVLIAGNINQRNAWTVETTFADTIKISAKEVNATNLEAFLNNLGGELVHAVLRGITDDVVNGTAAVSGCTMLADVLDAPVTELAMSDNVNACKNLLNAGALRRS
jgi:hypothetical protein